MNFNLGNRLTRAREKREAWRKVMFAFLGLLVILNIFIRPHHAEFVLDAYPGFWAAFGLGVACLMVYVMKKIVQPKIVRPEETHDGQ